MATILARSKTLVHFDLRDKYTLSPPNFNQFCAELSINFDTELEELRLDGYCSRYIRRLDLHGDQGTVMGIGAAIENKIRNMLKCNVQRRTCAPLFAAIGKTNSKRKRCLVEAFGAADIPVVFEYITTNENNLISLIQQPQASERRLNALSCKAHFLWDLLFGSVWTLFIAERELRSCCSMIPIYSISCINHLRSPQVGL